MKALRVGICLVIAFTGVLGFASEPSCRCRSLVRCYWPSGAGASALAAVDAAA